MKTIKNISVTTTYSVGLGGLEVPDEVYDELMKWHDEDLGLSDSHITKDYDNAFDWLMKNIKETDAHSWEFEIYEIE